ncbi:MAG: penicillin-binding protein 2 [Gammaproteobacteria bacterium]|nr:penicillin-binding protein 2 [Gammaproteobacteria bacterium]
MPGSVRFTNPEQSARTINLRIVISAVIMVLMCGLLLSRLAYLQIVNAEYYTTLSQNNRVKVLPLAPPRGLIFSRDGTIVAENRPSFVLAIDTAVIGDLHETVAALSGLLELTQDDIDSFFAEVKSRGRVDEVALGNNLSETQLARFAAQSHRFPGVRIDARLTRYYPQTDLWAHVLGYVGRINEQELKSIDTAEYRGTSHIGKSGIEYTYETILHGSVGFQKVEINAQGRILRVLERTLPEPGRDLYLTIDAGLQQLAFELLAGNRGAIVALDPLTGGVLAFASNPSFNPNLFVNGISSKDYALLRDSPDRPLFNRALQGQYPPGSTVKPLVALAGLQNGVRTTGEETWCPGWYRLPGEQRRYHDWQRQGHGHVNLIRALAESCDIYFYDLARDLGIDTLSDFMRQFGLNSPTGIDLPGEAGGIFPNSEWKARTRKQPWYPGETLSVGIGQGFTLATPLQLAFATSILARHGVGITPHVVGQIEDPLLHQAVEPEFVEREMVSLDSDQYWTDVTHGMEEVVHGNRGTARKVGQNAGYRFAGKSGTAQLFSLPQDVKLSPEEISERLRDHALFVAFGPLENPQIAVAVIVENGVGGSSTAAPMARAIMDQYLQPSRDVSLTD